MQFFGISATLVLVHGGFQAYLLGISVMTGNGHYLAMQWALSCSHCYTEFGYLSLWEDGIACSWLQMFATHNVRVISLLR